VDCRKEIGSVIMTVWKTSRDTGMDESAESLWRWGEGLAQSVGRAARMYRA
jgi:hypothetical protein